MKITKSQLRKIIKEEINSEADSIASDQASQIGEENYDILDKVGDALLKGGDAYNWVLDSDEWQSLVVPTSDADTEDFIQAINTVLSDKLGMNIEQLLGLKENKMKITKSHLRKIIKEESAKVLNEYYPGFEGSPEQAGMQRREREKSRASRKAADDRQAGYEASAENNAKMARLGKKDGSVGAKPRHLDDPSYKKAFRDAYKYAGEVAYSRKMTSIGKEREGMSDLNFIKKGRLQQKYKELSKQKRSFSNTFNDDTWMQHLKS